MQTAFLAQRIFDGSRILEEQAVLVHDDEIVGLAPASDIPGKFNKRDLGDVLLAPAFMDLQIYGGNGKLFSTELTVEALEATYESCLQGGCTQFMITMATNSIDKFLSGIDRVRDYWARGGKGLIGMHLEGPYISTAKRGAHIEKFIKRPESEEVKMLLDKGRNVIKMITLAPECCDREIIDMVLRNQVIGSAGHSNATYQEAMDGFEAGIPVATHLFNAMSPLQGRQPGMVGAIYDSTAHCSIVCDGVHVDFASVRISQKIMQERLFFITDAVAEVRHGEYQHIFKSDRYTLPDGTLSGSTLTMSGAVKNGVEKAGIELTEALRMASLYPARLMKLDKKYGNITSGRKADFAILDEGLNLRTLIVEGE